MDVMFKGKFLIPEIGQRPTPVSYLKRRSPEDHRKI